MLKVKVITIGRCKEAWLEEALAEYQKRLLGTLAIEWVLIKQKLEWAEHLQKAPHVIALDVQGSLLSSEAFSHKLYHTWGARPVFVIGGADGLPTEILQQVSFRWSLSPLTFPHQIVRLLLLEQFYRAQEIDRGSAYHKNLKARK